jgi:hypothetical protein
MMAAGQGRASMLRGFYKSGWRGAVGLIAAYALVLQAFLAYGMASQAAAQDASLDSGAFIICVSHDADPASGGADVPVKHAHCPICTLSGSSAAVLAEPAPLYARQAAWVERTAFVSAAACISFHRARAGFSQAPPQGV